MLDRVTLHIVKRDGDDSNLDPGSRFKTLEQCLDLLFRAGAQLAGEIIEHSLRLRELRIGKGNTGEKNQQGGRSKYSSEGFMHVIKTHHSRC